MIDSFALTWLAGVLTVIGGALFGSFFIVYVFTRGLLDLCVPSSWRARAPWAMRAAPFAVAAVSFWPFARVLINPLFW